MSQESQLIRPSCYALDWAAAVERTRRFDLEVPAHSSATSTRHLNAERQAEFPYVVRQGLGDLDFSDVVAQCLSIHFRLVPVIQKWLGCPALYTLGWIDDGTEGGMFKFDEAFIADRLKSGRSSGIVNMHAWLTLPSMEVIDVALATTIAVAQNLPTGHGAVLAKYADDLWGMAYKPMLVGKDFLLKSGLLVAIP